MEIHSYLLAYRHTTSFQNTNFPSKTISQFHKVLKICKQYFTQLWKLFYFINPLKKEESIKIISFNYVFANTIIKGYDKISICIILAVSDILNPIVKFYGVIHNMSSYFTCAILIKNVTEQHSANENFTALKSNNLPKFIKWMVSEELREIVRMG